MTESKIGKQVKAAEKEWIEGWTRGPRRLHWQEIPLQVLDRAPDFALPNLEDQTVKLSSFWQDQPALILFWWHYGCSRGVDRAAMLQREYNAYLEA
jgi:hypothetical protein